MTSEGTRWALKLGAVHLIFHPNAVSEPTSIVVYRWKSSVCSPPLQEHEAIVSNVIELSSLDGRRLQFNTMVTLSLSHSAPELRGYEVVIKRQINKETNEWEDVSGTKDLRCRQGIEFISMYTVVDLWQLQITVWQTLFQTKQDAVYVFRISEGFVMFIFKIVLLSVTVALALSI